MRWRIVVSSDVVPRTLLGFRGILSKHVRKPAGPNLNPMAASRVGTDIAQVVKP